jgi:WD40 repeat protein
MPTVKRILSLSFVLLVACGTAVPGPEEGAATVPASKSPEEAAAPAVTASAAPSATPTPVTPTPLPPDAYNPQTWADYVLIQDYWPVIKETVGDAVGDPFQSLNLVDYSSAGGYVAVAGCDHRKLDYITYHFESPPACESESPEIALGGTVIGAVKAANAFAFILDARSGEIIATLPPTGTQTTVSCMGFSHDGTDLFYGTNSGQLVVWDIASRSIETEIPQPPPLFAWEPHCAAFAPDDRLMAVNYGPLIRIWDRAARMFLAELVEPGWPEPFFSADGQTLLLVAPEYFVYSSGTWEKLSGRWDFDKPYKLTAGNVSPDFALAVDTDMKYYINEPIENGPIRVTDLKTGDLLQTLEGKWHDVGLLAFSPDGRYLLRHDLTGRELVYWQVDGWEYSEASSVMEKMVDARDQFLLRLYFSSDGNSVLLSTLTRLALYGLP